MGNYEVMQITSADGITYDLRNDHGRFILSTPGNLGLAPVEFQTFSTFKQDGVLETGFRLNPRTFSLNFHENNDCSREQFWAIRQALIDVLRPNRNGQFTFTIIQAGGAKYSIKGRTTSPIFAETDNNAWSEWAIDENIQVECFDPVWFASDVVTQSVTRNPAQQLVFPITFDANNIFFGAGDSFASQAISYGGTWYTYPTIVVTGSFTYVEVYHQELQVSLRLIYTAPIGETVTFNLSERTITNQAGTSLFGYLTSTSDLQGMKIEPDPVVANGVNTLIFTIGGITVPNTTVTISYLTRYIGI